MIGKTALKISNKLNAKNFVVVPDIIANIA